MNIGYLRAGRRGPSIERQREDLAAAGLRPAALESDWERVAARLGRGDVLILTGLAALAANEAEALARLAAVAAVGATVRCLDTGDLLAPEFGRNWLGAKRAWAAEKLCGDPAEMRRRGQKGGRPRVIEPGSDIEQAVRAIWRDPKNDRTNQQVAEDVSRLMGQPVSPATLARNYGRRVPLAPSRVDALVDEARRSLLMSAQVANRVGVGAAFVSWEQVELAEAASAEGLIERRADGRYYLTEAGTAALAGGVAKA